MLNNSHLPLHLLVPCGCSLPFFLALNASLSTLQPHYPIIIDTPTSLHPIIIDTPTSLLSCDIVLGIVILPLACTLVIHGWTFYGNCSFWNLIKCQVAWHGGRSSIASPGGHVGVLEVVRWAKHRLCHFKNWLAVLVVVRWLLKSERWLLRSDRSE
jgi:hypothetical protein